MKTARTRIQLLPASPKDVAEVRSIARPIAKKHGFRINVRKGRGSVAGFVSVAGDPRKTTAEGRAELAQALIDAGFESWHATVDPSMSLRNHALRLALEWGHDSINFTVGRYAPGSVKLAGYYDTRRTTLDEVRRQWAEHGNKVYDDSMPLMISVRDLWKIREYTWTREKSRPGPLRVDGKVVSFDGPTKWDMLKEKIRTEGFDPRAPLQVMVGRDGGARVGEGNHRLAIAKELGIREVPVWFQYYQKVAPKNPMLSQNAPEKVTKKVVKKVLDRSTKKLSPKRAAT